MMHQSEKVLLSGLSTLHISPFESKTVSLLPKPSFDVAEYFRDHRAILTRSDREYVSMADSRTLNVSGRYEFEPEEEKLILRLGGSLVQIKTGLNGPASSGVRGLVTGFSSASRRRLLRLIASLERSNRPVFITMTYPDVFPPEQGKWKRDLDVFGKRLVRKFPLAGALWRIEFKERRTGANKGRVAPHFHLLVYGGSFRGLLEWVSDAWWKVVGSGDKDHLAVGTRVERVWSWGGIMRYVGKYIAKVDPYPADWQGKAWGVIGRKRLPWAVEVIISLTSDESIKLVRLGRKMIKANGRSFSYGLTWIVNAERVLDYLELLQGFR